MIYYSQLTQFDTSLNVIFNFAANRIRTSFKIHSQSIWRKIKTTLAIGRLPAFIYKEEEKRLQGSLCVNTMFTYIVLG